jgi:hypothetical protein
VGVLHSHTIQHHLELLGHEHGQRGIHALAHLRLRENDRDDIVAADAHESVRREGGIKRRGRRSRGRHATGAIDSTAEQQSAACRGDGDYEVPP